MWVLNENMISIGPRMLKRKKLGSHQVLLDLSTTDSDWKRTKSRIKSYNNKLLRQRKDRIPNVNGTDSSLIHYREL